MHTPLSSRFAKKKASPKIRSKRKTHPPQFPAGSGTEDSRHLKQRNAHTSRQGSRQAAQSRTRFALEQPGPAISQSGTSARSYNNLCRFAAENVYIFNSSCHLYNL